MGNPVSTEDLRELGHRAIDSGQTELAVILLAAAGVVGLEDQRLLQDLASVANDIARYGLLLASEEISRICESN